MRNEVVNAVTKGSAIVTLITLIILCNLLDRRISILENNKVKYEKIDSGIDSLITNTDKLICLRQMKLGVKSITPITDEAIKLKIK